MEMLKAIRYRNIDEALGVLAEALGESTNPFDDNGQEPQGLLAVIPEDRLPERSFYRLLDLSRGTLVEVEKIPYSGFGPPAEEADYMGFVSQRQAYVLAGCRLPVEIQNCPDGARDIHHLEAMVMDRQHPFDAAYLAEKLGLPEDWDFDQIFDLIAAGQCTADLIDRLLHEAGEETDD